MELVARAQKTGIETLALSAEVFASLTAREHPQGILAVAEWRRRSLESLSPPRWGVALVEPQDPGNIGTILRTMDAVGADVLFLVGNSADPTHPGAVRASMGALFWIPVVQCDFPA
ncbi:MAG: RNA methyltransferase, partial [Anaerolineae bacterium]